ncbi:MAG: T9SS type A sorting domain-containing protein [Caldithrix sp.]|nr:T9SS type A sorting domain-containing protein [Caldithrix sp.]
MKNVLVYFLLLNALVSAQNPRILLNLPWGQGHNQAGLRKAPEGLYGPASFRTDGKQILLLDRVNQSLKIFENNQHIDHIPVPPYCDDFVYVSKDHYIFLKNNQLMQIQNGQQHILYRPESQNIIQQIQPITSSEIDIQLSNGNSVIQDIAANQAVKKNAGLYANSGFNIKTERKDKQTGIIQLFNDNSSDTSFSIDFPEENLASFQFVGMDNDNRIFVDIELFEQEVPVRIKRQVRRFDTSGDLLTTIQLPPGGYSHAFRDLFIDSSGSLYYMHRTEKGLQILEWPLVQNEAQEYPFHFKSPDWEYHINNADDALPEFGAGDAFFKPADFPQVTPEEALTIGDAYVQLQWECGPENLSNGLIMDNYGYYVRTPYWLYQGTVNRVPYKWGGFQTVNQFLDGIAGGKYAGDNYTSKSSGSPSAVGVDCSGFVSRCWKLPTHYSTRMMDDDITKAYSSWDELRPGDACHKPGHVRLIVNHNADGTINMVESAGYNWRVSYRHYSYTDLIGYTPRYYINMQGTPGNIPQPTLQNITGNDPTKLEWFVGGKENIHKINLYASTEGTHWDFVKHIAADSNSSALSTTADQAYYYCLKSVAAVDEQSESIPSDGYGVLKNAHDLPVLIVDGFDRTTSSYGSWPHNYHNFVITLGQSLQANGIGFESTANEAVMDSSILLDNYPAVFWLLGDESTADETFNDKEQSLLKSYLQNGGKLFVSGSEVGWDLDHKGASSDRTFFADMLKAEYVQDDAGSYTVNGNGGTPFNGLNLHYDDGSHGIYEEDYPDALKAVHGGQAALSYGNGKTAAVYFAGSYNNANEAKLFYMGFPFETIYEEAERVQLMRSICGFFELKETALEEKNRLAASKSFQLYSNYPNPFNSSTKLHFYLPNAGHVRFKLYDVLGKSVHKASHYFSTPGKQEWNLSLHHLSTGVYYLQLIYETQKGLQTRHHKLQLIK